MAINLFQTLGLVIYFFLVKTLCTTNVCYTKWLCKIIVLVAEFTMFVRGSESYCGLTSKLLLVTC